MNKLDKVETVREKTGVTYEEAREALEHHDYDVLDAIVELEQQGKTQTHTAHHTTTSTETTVRKSLSLISRFLSETAAARTSS